MRNSLFAILVSCLFLWPALAQDPGYGSALTEPVPSGGWQKNGELPCSFGAAKVRMRTQMERKGFTLKHEIDLGNRGERCLQLWQRDQDNKQWLVMLWRKNVDLTGYSIGEIQEKKK
ncbi:MAG: hypothetical protein IJJ26_06655 [Victivallales bacterium]|nr:hypothetical protein [Victivallales bacterium]